MSGTSGRELRTSLKLPWRIRFILAALNAISNASIRRNGTVNRCLMTLIDFKVPLRQAIDPSRNLWFRYFLPRCTTSGKIFQSSSISRRQPRVPFPSSKSYDDLCRRLAGELPAIVVSVNYRLAPEHKFPSPYEDGVEILKFIDENPPANADLTRCFIVGDSAGGNLVHHVTARAGEHDFRNLKIAGAILIQPFFGGEERTESEIQLAGTPLWSVEPSGGERIRAEIERYIGVEVSEKFGVHGRL
ncbi:hypothetical protein AAG906_000459 [Vitis piasezkii]